MEVAQRRDQEIDRCEQAEAVEPLQLVTPQRGQLLLHSLLPLEAYARARGEFRERVLAHKKARTVHLGEEWAATSPFPFFADHDSELAEAVRDGRRAEFAEFGPFITGMVAPVFGPDVS